MVLNKNAAGATCGKIMKDNYVSSGNRRVNRKLLRDKSTHTNA
jgi:hypothetical protein